MKSNNDKQRIIQLAEKWLDGTISDQEKNEFNTWYDSHPDELLELSDHLGASPLIIRERLHANILKAIADKGPKARTISLWTKLLVSAASILLITGLLFKYRTPIKDIARPSSSVMNVPPGSNKAMLTLANGRQIALTDAGTGKIATEGPVDITKSARGQITYGAASGLRSNTSQNTIETPRGGQYQVILPDGTQVWLNAASKLIFPVSFMGRGQRVVELSGEAYFEVAKDKAHAFIVRTGQQQVKVLGTHFNINSYKDEGQTITTLQEGSVMVTAGVSKQIIQPGEQTILASTGQLSSRKADLEVALAWRKNEFVFKDANVQQVMKEVARWYDIRVVYDGQLPDDTITGSIDRSSNIDVLLQMLATIQLHFKLVQTGSTKTLIVSR